MREQFEKLFPVPDGVVFEDGEYLPVISGDCFRRGKNEDMAKLTNFAWMAFQDTKDNAEGAHTVSIHLETWEKLREMNGDAWECDGHRELVVDTMLNYAYPHFLEKSRSGLF